ncbi:threonine ammonia-lyase IlvA [Aestuariibius sp. 2305UL40-4]|uniref:threonine ammonia-lyase IlvA n=1 Tax=Aestuariibius violaceus TaxID=3234132 RepID=UPI00345E51AB
MPDDPVTGGQAAAKAMRTVFPETPLQPNAHLSAKYGAEIWLKREDLSPVRSYKIRGAFNAMRKQIAHGKTRFVCASAGNHAQGVAYMCNHFGAEGTIFMPVTTPAQKIEKTRIFGGGNVSIELTGDYFDDSLAAAKAHCNQTGAHFLSPFDDDDVIEGQASVAIEIDDQLPDRPDLVVLPVGGGGLSSGMRTYWQAKGTLPELAYVEPKGGQSLRAALEAGQPVTLPTLDTFVDGAAVARIGAHPFARLADVDPSALHAIPEDRLCATIIEMLNIEGIVLEPAGALSIDALRDMADRIKGRRVVCVTTGGNFDFERLPEVRERAQRSLGLKKYFILRLPQRPGALRDFLEVLGPHDDIARFEYLKKSARNYGSVLIGIETTDPANFATLFGRLDAQGFVYRDITDDPTLAEFLI